mgnify:CR=1 FL=1
MSDNKNIRSKFESEEYLKNFIPNNEDKNRFFEFYEEQEIKKSLKEKFFSEQYIQSFKVSKKEWRLFEKTYLPSYWNYADSSWKCNKLFLREWFKFRE